jgi:hypothetical protein
MKLFVRCQVDVAWGRQALPRQGKVGYQGEKYSGELTLIDAVGNLKGGI